MISYAFVLFSRPTGRLTGRPVGRSDVLSGAAMARALDRRGTIYISF